MAHCHEQATHLLIECSWRTFHTVRWWAVDASAAIGKGYQGNASWRSWWSKHSDSWPSRSLQRKFSCAEIVCAGMRVAVHVAQCHGHLLSISDMRSHAPSESWEMRKMLSFKDLCLLQRSESRIQQLEECRLKLKATFHRLFYITTLWYIWKRKRTRNLEQVCGAYDVYLSVVS